MKNNDLNFELTEINTYYVPSDDYYTFEADLKPSKFISNYILSSYILLFHDQELINSSINNLKLFENEEDVCSLYDGIYENCDFIPNSCEIVYRVFDLVSENTLDLKISSPDDLPTKEGLFKVIQPKLDTKGSNKWNFGSIFINSISIRKIEDSYEFCFNLKNDNFLNSIPIIEIIGNGWSHTTDPVITEGSKFRTTINIYEEINSSPLELKFMFYQGNETKILQIQNIPKPENNILYDDGQ